MLESPRRIHDPVNIIPEIVMGDEGPIPTLPERTPTLNRRVNDPIGSRRLMSILSDGLGSDSAAVRSFTAIMTRRLLSSI